MFGFHENLLSNVRPKNFAWNISDLCICKFSGYVSFFSKIDVFLSAEKRSPFVLLHAISSEELAEVNFRHIGSCWSAL